MNITNMNIGENQIKTKEIGSQNMNDHIYQKWTFHKQSD
jgi:hypothetical protein